MLGLHCVHLTELLVDSQKRLALLIYHFFKGELQLRELFELLHDPLDAYFNLCLKARYLFVHLIKLRVVGYLMIVLGTIVVVVKIIIKRYHTVLLPQLVDLPEQPAYLCQLLFNYMLAVFAILSMPC